jgi:hypothetical protein
MANQTENTQDFAVKLLTFIGAEIHANLLMNASRDLFGQSLFALSTPQRTELDEKLHSILSPAFESLTERSLTMPEGGSSSGLIQ